MATTGLKNIYATELDANTSTNEEQDLGCFRHGVDGTIYRLVIIGSGGCTTGQALVESTAGTDTTLVIAPLDTVKPIAAFAQSTITANYYGWVIWEGLVDDAIADEGIAANAPIRGPGAGGTAGRVRGGAGATSLVASRTSAAAAASTFTVRIR